VYTVVICSAIGGDPNRVGSTIR